jgi:hypothetical protein
VKNEIGSQELFIEEIYGTAFSINNGYYLTAGHTIKNIKADGRIPGLAYCPSTEYFTSEIKDIEFHNNFDICIIKSEIPISKCFKWEENDLKYLANILSAGFPYALDTEKNVINLRAFKGYIVSRSPFSVLKNKQQIYELSFQAPRGLSGSPIIYTSSLKIAGIIIGNISTKMLIFSEEEVLNSEEKKTIERYELLQFGIAIRALSLFNTHSRLLNDTIYNYLHKNDLI